MFNCLTLSNQGRAGKPEGTFPLYLAALALLRTPHMGWPFDW